MEHQNQTLEHKQSIKNSTRRGIVVVLSLLIQILIIVKIIASLDEYSTLVSLAISIAAFIVVLRIYGSHVNTSFKIPQMVLIMLFPIAGLCIYAIVGSNIFKATIDKKFRKENELLRELYQFDESLTDKISHEYPDFVGHMNYLQKSSHYPVYDKTDVTYYDDAAKGLEAQLVELEKAEKYIFMEYHAIQDSYSWQRIEDILKKKAAAGVEVRVLYDDMGSLGFISKAFIQKLSSYGITCRVFNPITPLLNMFMNNRDHRKITIIDGKVGFVGGYNLADEYFGVTHPYGHWKDTGIKLVGSAVRSLILIFAEVWGGTQKDYEDITPYLDSIPDSDITGDKGYIIPYASGPIDETFVAENVYMNVINAAKKYVWITTPYLILDDEMQHALKLAALRGVDVRIITPGIPDKKVVYKATRSYYNNLIAGGVRIYEYTPGFIHAKQFVSDDNIAIVGTINMDYRSFYMHFENACLLYGCECIKDIKTDFEEMFPICRDVTDVYGSNRKMSLRMGQCILRFFAPLM